MKLHQIAAKRKRRFVVTTDSKHDLPVAENTLNQDFQATQANEKWVTDITYIHTKEGWLYLAVILDLFSRKIIGWSMDAHMERWLVINALKMAIQSRHPPKGLLHRICHERAHRVRSDRGSLADPMSSHRQVCMPVMIISKYSLTITSAVR